MNMVEGVGLQPPKRIRICFADGDLTCAVKEANRRAAMRGYANGTGTWKPGMTGKKVLQDGTIIEPHIVPVLTGIVGEYAVAKSINRRLDREVCSVDLTLKRDGDGGIDLSPFGFGLDVKTRMRDYGENLIRCRKENGVAIQYACKAFVFCEWAVTMTCDIIGWAAVHVVRSLPEVEARRGDHLNHELRDNDLEPFPSLVDLLRGIA